MMTCPKLVSRKWWPVQNLSVGNDDLSKTCQSNPLTCPKLVSEKCWPSTVVSYWLQTEGEHRLLTTAHSHIDWLTRLRIERDPTPAELHPEQPGIDPLATLFTGSSYLNDKFWTGKFVWLTCFGQVIISYWQVLDRSSLLTDKIYTG